MKSENSIKNEMAKEMTGYSGFSILKNWKIEKTNGAWRLVGEVYQDARGRFEDGGSIVTSSLVFVDFSMGFARTKNSFYRLDCGGFFKNNKEEVLDNDFGKKENLNIVKPTRDEKESAEENFSYNFSDFM